MCVHSHGVGDLALKCGSWTRLANVYADLDGEAFKAYYCVDTCVPKEKDEDSIPV